MPDDLALPPQHLIPHNCLVDILVRVPSPGSWTSATRCIGDRHQDFQYLEGFVRAGVIEAAIRRYEAITGRTLSRWRIAL